MSIKTYNKLVRDRIPEIIEASGKTCVTEILSDEAYLEMLDKKLDEELAEYHKDQNIEELADLFRGHPRLRGSARLFRGGAGAGTRGKGGVSLFAVPVF